MSHREAAAPTVEQRMEGIASALRSRGQRVTPQRLAIMRALLRRADHPSAEAVHAELRGDYPTMAISTVYDTLRLLVRLGEAMELAPAMPEARFDPLTRDHCHLVCLSCGAIVDLPLEGCSDPPGLATATGALGFRPARRIHQVFGHCAACDPG